MKSLVQRLKPLVIRSGVNRGRGNVGMPQQMLNISQVEATVQEMCSKSVSQGLRIDGAIDAGSNSGRAQDFPNTHTGQRAPFGIAEKGHVLAVAGLQQRRSPKASIARCGGDGRSPERHHALASPPSMYTEQGMLKKQVGAVQSNQFRHPQTSGVKNLKDCPISHGQRILTLHRIYESLRLVHRQRIWLLARHVRLFQADGRIEGAGAGVEEAVVKAPQRTQIASDRGSTAAGFMQIPQVGAGSIGRNPVRCAYARSFAEVKVALEIASIRRDRRGRQRAIDRDSIEVGLQEAAQRGRLWVDGDTYVGGVVLTLTLSLLIDAPSCSSSAFFQ
jgi:hypothetical protein